jgi:hypothetical protein
MRPFCFASRKHPGVDRPARNRRGRCRRARPRGAADANCAWHAGCDPPGHGLAMARNHGRKSRYGRARHGARAGSAGAWLDGDRRNRIARLRISANCERCLRLRSGTGCERSVSRSVGHRSDPRSREQRSPVRSRCLPLRRPTTRGDGGVATPPREADRRGRGDGS